MNWELTDVQTEFSKGKGTRDQIANICMTIEKAKAFQKNIYFCFTDCTKVFDLKRWKYQTILPVSWENLYTCQEATVRTSYGTTDWFKIEKGVWQGCLLSSCLFNLYTEHIMGNSELDESQVGIKTAGKNSNIFRCKWYHFNGRKWRRTKKPLDEGERDEWKSQLKSQCLKKTKIMVSGPITSW